MKKYFAWLFFVLGATYLYSLAHKVATGKIHDAPPMLFTLMSEPSWENLGMSLISMVPVFIIGTAWYFWHKWK